MPEVLVVVDPELRPHPPHEPHQRLRLGLGARPRAGVVGARARPVAPAPGEVAVEVHAARVLARVAPRARPGCRCARARTRRRRRARRRSAATIASPAGSLPCTSPTTSTFTGAPSSPTRVARISRPCDGVADDERRGERGGDQHSPWLCTVSRRGARRDRRVRGRSARRWRGGWPGAGTTSCWSTSSSPGDVRATSGGETRLIRCVARRGRRLRGDGAAGADAVARARGRVRRATLLTETGVSWFAHRDDGWEAEVGARAARARHPDRAAGRSSRRRRASRRSTATTSRGCCTSPRPACCARSARCRRSRGAAAARGARDRARPRDAGRRRACALDDGTVARGRPVVWSCGGWLAEALPRPRPAARDAPGAVLLRRRARRGATRPRGSTTTAPSTAPATSTSSASRSRGTQEGPPLDPDADLPPATAETERAHARLRRRPLPRARRRAAEGHEDLPLRDHARLPLHRRAAPGARRACGSSAAAPATASSTARRWPSGSSTAWDGGAPLPPHFALGERPRARAVAQERGLELSSAPKRAGRPRTASPSASGCTSPRPGGRAGTAARRAACPCTSPIFASGAKCLSACRPSGTISRGSDQLELALQERHPVRDLRRLRVAVLRRPRLDDVRDPDVPRTTPASASSSSSSFPARPTNGRPSSSSVAPAPRRRTRRRRRVPLAGDHPRRGLARLVAAPAVRDDLVAQRDQSTSRRWTAHRESSCRVGELQLAQDGADVRLDRLGRDLSRAAISL